MILELTVSIGGTVGIVSTWYGAYCSEVHLANEAARPHVSWVVIAEIEHELWDDRYCADHLRYPDTVGMAIMLSCRRTRERLVAADKARQAAIDAVLRERLREEQEAWNEHRRREAERPFIEATKELAVKLLAADKELSVKDAWCTAQRHQGWPQVTCMPDGDVFYDRQPPYRSAIEQERAELTDRRPRAHAGALDNFTAGDTYYSGWGSRSPSS